MGIFKSLYLIPKSHYLRLAVVSDLVDARGLVYALTVLEDRNEKLLGGIVGHGLGLPYLNRIEELERLALVYGFIKYAELICNGSSCFLIENSIYLLEVRVSDLLGVFGDLDLWDNLSVLLHGYELVNAAEHGIGFRGNESFTDSEDVYSRSLKYEVTDKYLIKRVGNYYFTLGVSRLVFKSNEII